MALALHKIDTLIWDLDGTLADSVADLTVSVNHVLSTYQLVQLSVAQVRAMIGNGASKLLQRAFAAAGGLNVYDSDEAYQHFLSHYADNCCNETVLYPGMSSVLSDCCSAGYKQGICTNKPEKMARDIVEYLSIAPLLEAVVGGDTTDHHKPHPEPMLRCLDLLGAEASGALMIGDSAADVNAARSVNIPIVLLPWGYTSDGVQGLGADYIAEDAAALWQILTNLSGSQTPS